MAVDQHNTDSLLLPSQSQFFTDDNTNILSDNNNRHLNQTCPSCFSSSDFGSVLSSPVESELGSTESDSEQDDDYIARLTRQMAHSMLQDDGNRRENKAWSLAGSLQSTKWSRLRSSQEEVSMLGKFENLKMKEEKFGYNNSERFLATRKPRNANLEIHSKQALIDYQIRAIQFYKLRQEQIMKQKQESLYWGKQANGFNHNEHDKQEARQFHQSKGRACTGSGNGQRVSWANLQQQQRTGSEMTAVFLGESGSRNGSFGTGVFLPRGIGNTCESRKKPGCSTVFIPERVVQSLKLHFDKMGSESRSNGASFPAQHDALTGDVRYGLQFQKKSRSWTVPAKNQEMSLPQEWTY
ncbi:hypothetical protein P3X46_015666 [Hevea brasiliensis]|uniref:DUF4005 domain-containing protein n=1 Tax=Hevea brasiliensis TaxID=3981 RepID=A0ABQ9LY15_HEVBR|nr:uncharacterized protein LOC110636936 [Hevea brasiliensis]KAJ9172425.1 hypothetical protein P3X46_015666 [Hevea brasiliensis]